MAMSAVSMANRIAAYLDQLDHTQIQNGVDSEAYAREARIAFCQGIIDEIIENSEVVTDSSHVGSVVA